LRICSNRRNLRRSKLDSCVQNVVRQGTLGDLRATVDARDKDECLGLLDTLHLAIQQHNAKEEAILYPLADRALASKAQDLLVGFGA